MFKTIKCYSFGVFILYLTKNSKLMKNANKKNVHTVLSIYLNNILSLNTIPCCTYINNLLIIKNIFEKFLVQNNVGSIKLYYGFRSTAKLFYRYCYIFYIIRKSKIFFFLEIYFLIIKYLILRFFLQKLFVYLHSKTTVIMRNYSKLSIQKYILRGQNNQIGQRHHIAALEKRTLTSGVSRYRLVMNLIT